MDSVHLGKFLLISGLASVLCSWLFTRLARNRRIGKLPGDIQLRFGNYMIHFPLLTGVILSLILTLLLNLIF